MIFHCNIFLSISEAIQYKYAVILKMLSIKTLQYTKEVQFVLEAQGIFFFFFKEWLYNVQKKLLSLNKSYSTCCKKGIFSCNIYNKL